MIIANFRNDSSYIVAYGLWQYNYGQKLRIQGLTLPTAVEIHFSLQETGGESVTRVGITKDGVTDVPIPDSMLENNGTNRDYKIYAFIYLTDDSSGETIRKIVMPVRSRPKPEAFDTPEDTELFREAIAAVNEAVENAKAAVTPTIGDNGNWFIDGEDTGKPSVGEGGGANSWNDLTDKPFYTEYGDWVDVLPETTPTMAYNEEYGFANVVSLTIGNTYNVVINGVEHECEAHSSWSGVLLLGNASALNPDIFPDNGQTFLVMCLDEKMAADMGSGIVATLMDGTELKTLAIKQREITKLVKLPVRYLPEKIVIKGDGTGTITCDLEPSKIVNILYFKPETEILFSGPCDDGYMVQKPISVVSNDTSAKVYFLGNMTAGERPTIAYINITSDGFSLVTFAE